MSRIASKRMWKSSRIQNHAYDPTFYAIDKGSVTTDKINSFSNIFSGQILNMVSFQFPYQAFDEIAWQHTGRGGGINKLSRGPVTNWTPGDKLQEVSQVRQES